MQKLRHLWVLVKGRESFVDVAGLNRTHAQLKIAGQIQNLFDERMKTRAVIVVPSDIYTRQHEFAEAGIDEFTRRIKRVLCVARNAAAACLRYFTVAAAFVAAVLNLERRAALKIVAR